MSLTFILKASFFTLFSSILKNGKHYDIRFCIAVFLGCISIQLLQLMDDMMYGMEKKGLPRDLNQAQLLLQDHLADYKTVHELFNFTTVHAQDVLNRAATSAAVSVSRDEIKGFLEKSEGRHSEWRSVWEHHKVKLEESVRLCEFQQAISTVCFNLLLVQ